jgi:hypothetical protein
MSLSDELREQYNMHPLDVDFEIFNVAADRIEELEIALVALKEANSNWAMNIDDNVADAIQNLIYKAESGGGNLNE